jgi:hypothetical protein
VIFHTGTYTDTPSAILLHGDWDAFGTTYDADIALIFVSKEVPLISFISPICLWDSNNYVNFYEGYDANQEM